MGEIMLKSLTESDLEYVGEIFMQDSWRLCIVPAGPLSPQPKSAIEFFHLTLSALNCWDITANVVLCLTS